jgi:hypothetical protein
VQPCGQTADSPSWRALWGVRLGHGLCTINKEAVARRQAFIDARQYELDSDWGDVQPSAAQQNAYPESYSWTTTPHGIPPSGRQRPALVDLRWASKINYRWPYSCGTRGIRSSEAWSRINQEQESMRRGKRPARFMIIGRHRNSK